MARQAAAVEVSAFIKGLITEASPLTFPDNASIDEVNMVLNQDGSRNRRLGMDYEPNYATFDTNAPPAEDLVFTSYNWKAPGGYTDKEFLAIQTGSRLSIFDSTILPISGQVIGTFDIGLSSSTRMSISSVDGILIVVTGGGTIYSVDWDGGSLSLNSGRLKIRDMFGVADTYNGFDLLSDLSIAKRPASTSSAHTYNLRNQTFAYPRKRQTGQPNASMDPIVAFNIASGGLYPANSDNLITYLYADPSNSTDGNTKRFFASDMYDNPLGTNRAPMGFFIIDALDRGASRLYGATILKGDNPLLTIPVNALPTDRTPDGASVVANYGGRIWYGGFSSQIIGGDSQSPRMTSYILFSQLVQSSADIYKCYQEGDPTSSETPDLVDTDGGFIRLDGAYNIQHMVNVGDSMMVVAANGVWRVSGGSGYGFTATNYLVSKVSEHGSIAPGSVTVLDNSFMYWGDDAIYHVSTNQYGDWVGTNISSSTIQTYYDKIPYTAKVKCQGMYDSYQRCVRWLYNNAIGDGNDATELVLDVNLSAFYPSRIGSITGTSYPKAVSLVRVPPFTNALASSNVVTNGGDVVKTAVGGNVTVSGEVVTSSTSEIFYLTAALLLSGRVRCTFSYYRDTTFVDWVSSNGAGKDAEAYLVTGWAGLGDHQRQKQVPYLTVYSLKTETGFDDNLIPTHPSSILVQSQWSWTNSAEAGKWGGQFQAYRHKRLWMPASSASGFDDGEYVITTRSKLRGRGRVLSLKFTTEPGKDFKLLGWSYVAAINGSV